MYVIRPFRAQGAGELAAALAVRRWAPLVTGISLAGTLLACWLLWRQSRRWIRVASAVAVTLTAACAVLANVNVFEIMFHRVDAPETMAASEAKLDTDDMVLSVRVADETRAYPIRMIAYHHIVNDVVGREPIVSTY
jgi:hypothetical protein